MLQLLLIYVSSMRSWCTPRPRHALHDIANFSGGSEDQAQGVQGHRGGRLVVLPLRVGGGQASEWFNAPTSTGELWEFMVPYLKRLAFHQAGKDAPVTEKLILRGSRAT